MEQVKARFTGHESCPKCGSRDNLGRYSDGSAWCFGCHYREPPRRSLQNVRDNNNNNDPISDFSGFSSVLPKQAIVWLRKYGLTPEECEHFQWDPGRQRLVVGITRADKLVFWQGRRFGAEGPKYLSSGRVPWDPPLTFGTEGPVVFTEDVVSAIKVGRQATGVPLFGSYMPAEALKWASGTGKDIFLWLDPDKFREALKQALRATAAGVRVHPVHSDRDPKEHTDGEIRAKLPALKKANTYFPRV